MKKKEKNRAAIKVLAYENPVFWKLEEDKRNPDVLESSISYFKEHGIAVDRITLPGRPSRYYAIWNAETEEEARDANRKLDKDEKNFFRRVMPMMQRETHSMYCTRKVMIQTMQMQAQMRGERNVA